MESYEVLAADDSVKVGHHFVVGFLGADVVAGCLWEEMNEYVSDE